MIFILTAICLWNPTAAAKRDEVQIDTLISRRYDTIEKCEDAMDRIKDSAAACEVVCTSENK